MGEESDYSKNLELTLDMKSAIKMQVHLPFCFGVPISRYDILSKDQLKAVCQLQPTEYKTKTTVSRLHASERQSCYFPELWHRLMTRMFLCRTL